MIDPFAAWVERDVIWVEGSWAGQFLQGQLTQDVLDINSGFSEWSLVLGPEGTVDFFLRVTRVSDTSWVLDIDAGWGTPLMARLTDAAPDVGVTLEPRAWKALRVAFVGMANLNEGPEAVTAWVRWFPWLPLGTIDVLAPSPKVPEGFPLVSPAQYEFRRIRSSFPQMGSEITHRTFPEETGLVQWAFGRDKTDDYVGRSAWTEASASAKRPQRQLRVLVFSGEAEPGCTLVTAGGEPAGEVTSVAFLPSRGWIGLGYLQTTVDEPHVLIANNGPRALLQEIPAWPSGSRT